MLKEHEAGTATAGVCHKRGVSTATLYRYNARFGGLEVPDACRFRVLGVVDNYSREYLALVADTALSGLCVAREPDALITPRGRPAMVVSDNGTEVTLMAVLSW